MYKFALYSFVFLTMFACTQTQTDRLVISLETGWKFKPGDSLLWAEPGFDDSSWDTIAVGRPWERSGYNYNGIAWYRKVVLIPDSLKTSLFADYPFVSLELGTIDDANEVYFNGKLIGTTGDMSRRNDLDYSLERKYLIASDQVLWGRENTIAVRVADHSGNGGMTNGPHQLSTAIWSDFYSLSAVFPSATEQVFSADQTTAYWSVKVSNSSSRNFKGQLIARVSTDQHKRLTETSKTIVIASGKDVSVDFDFEFPSPGFYELDLALVHPKFSDTLLLREYMGYTPDSIESSLSRPADFADYWQRAKSELKTVRPDFKMTRVDSLSSPTIEVYEVSMRSWGNARVGGWYSLPRNSKGKLPVLVRMIGYSGSNQPILDRPDFAALSFNIRGHGNSCQDVNPGFPGYIAHNIHDKETYIYKGAFMDCVRAIDFICSRPEADTSRIAVYGGSQGGALSFATAALDSRVDLCAPHIPFLSDFRTYFKIAHFPKNEIEGYMAAHPELKWEQVYATLDYIDIKNLTPWITCPVLMGVGLRDQVCPPVTNFAGYNNLGEVEKEWHVFAKYGHAVPDSQHEYELQWIMKHFGMDR